MSHTGTNLVRPKPIRLSPNMRSCKSQIFADQKFTSPFTSLPLPELTKSHSYNCEKNDFRSLGPSLEKLAGLNEKEDNCDQLKEIAFVEKELKTFNSPQPFKTSFSEVLMNCSENSEIFLSLRKSCPVREIPLRPSNPMVKDKHWANEMGGSSTEEDSDEENVECKNPVNLERNTERV